MNPLPSEDRRADAKARTAGLRVASLLLAGVSLAHIARLWAGADVNVGGHHFGRLISYGTIVVAGVLSIWLARLAGPWVRDRANPPAT